MTMEDDAGFWAGRRVLVTGSSGFLGSWLVRELRALEAVTIGLVRDGMRHMNVQGVDAARPDFIVSGSIEDFDICLRAVNEYEADTVFHLAAQPIVGTAYRNPRSTFEANIRGTWNVLEACREAGTVRRIVVASSDKAYGIQPRLPYDEEMPLLGRHPYDASKSCTDIIAQTYHVTYGLPVAITRAGNFFGGGDLNFNRIVPGTIALALRGERPVLRSDGTMVRDYIYVRDVVNAYLTLARRLNAPEIRGEAFNFSSGFRHSVLEITWKILELMGRRELDPLILNEARAEIPEQYLSSEKARRMLDWRPRYTLEEALGETIDWYRDFVAAREARAGSTARR